MFKSDWTNLGGVIQVQKCCFGLPVPERRELRELGSRVICEVVSYSSHAHKVDPYVAVLSTVSNLSSRTGTDHNYGLTR